MDNKDLENTDESLVENFEDTNPYRHIEEANEENYKAVDKNNE